MRGFLIGLVILPAVVLATLSFRPGGLHNALRNVVRRLKLALLLAGVYLLGSSLAKLLFRDQIAGDLLIGGLAVGLAVVFIVQAQDRQLPS